jgi:hypothetical protein
LASIRGALTVVLSPYLLASIRGARTAARRCGNTLSRVNLWIRSTELSSIQASTAGFTYFICAGGTTFLGSPVDRTISFAGCGRIQWPAFAALELAGTVRRCEGIITVLGGNSFAVRRCGGIIALFGGNSFAAPGRI